MNISIESGDRDKHFIEDILQRRHTSHKGVVSMVRKQGSVSEDHKDILFKSI